MDSADNTSESDVASATSESSSNATVNSGVANPTVTSANSKATNLDVIEEASEAGSEASHATTSVDLSHSAASTISRNAEGSDENLDEKHSDDKSATESETLTQKSNSGSLFIESQHKISPNDSFVSAESSISSDRPASAGRHRTPITTESSSEKFQSSDSTSIGAPVVFSAMKKKWAEGSDEEADLIISRLKETLATPPPETKEEESPQEATFPTSIPEEQLEEARRRQHMKRLEREANLWDPENAPPRLTMQNVIDGKVRDHFSRGVEHSKEGRFEAAITSFTKALNLQPDYVACYGERAEVYLQLCDFRSAHLNFKKAYQLDPDNDFLFEKLAFTSYMEGQCLFDQGLYSEALESFARAAEMKPHAQSYHTRTIACLAALGRNQECLSLVTRRLDAESTGNPELYVLRARLHRMFRNATLCYYDVRDALSLDSEQPEAKRLMSEIRQLADNAKQQAVSLTIQGKLHEALKRINTAVETDPSLSEYHVLRGAIYRRMQNFNAAIDDYLLAMDKADHNENDSVYKSSQRQLLLTYNDFAVYCYHREFFEEAVVLLNKAIKGEKSEKGLYINRGDCFFKMNDLGFALADYQQALELEPDCWSTKCRIAVVHNEFGILAYQERQYQEAVIRFTQAIEHNPKVGQFYVHCARSRYLMQDVDSARKDLLLSLHLDPENDEIVPLLSRMYPGRSVKEVLASAAAQNARDILTTILGVRTTTTRSMTARSTSKPPATSSSTRDSTPNDERASTAVKEVERLASAQSDSPGPRKMPTDTEIIAEKRQVSNDLKKVFLYSKSLNYSGPKVSYAIPRAPRKPDTSDEEKQTRGYNWRKFNMGMAPV